MGNNRAQINTTLQVCGFTVQAHQNFLLTSESLDTWASFEAIEYDDFASISKMLLVISLFSHLVLSSRNIFRH